MNRISHPKRLVLLSLLALMAGGGLAATTWWLVGRRPPGRFNGDIQTAEVPIASSFSELPPYQDSEQPQGPAVSPETSHLLTPETLSLSAYIDIRPFLSPGDRPYVCYIAAHGRLVYACLSGGHLVWSADDGTSWRRETTIEHDGEGGKERRTYLVTVTKAGTVIVMGERLSGKKWYIAVWRKPSGSRTFSRMLLCQKRGGPPSSVSEGRLGLVFCQYSSLNLFRSQDDGQSWSKISFRPETAFKDHVHCVWVHPSEPYVYVSGGDAGPRYGKPASVQWDGLGGVVRTSDFRNWRKIYTEQPGERIVPIIGTQRRRFFGIELANSGALATYDDETYEVVFGRRSLGFLNFDALRYTPEGLLIAGTYQYKNITHGGYGQAGEVWLSDDEGASFQRLRTAFSIVSAVAYNSQYLFVGFGYGGAGGQVDDGTHILKLPTQGFLNHLKREPKVAKLVINMTDQTQARELGAQCCTHTVNMAPYKRVAVYAKVESACEMEVQAHAYEHDSSYTRDYDRWVTVDTLRFDGPGEQTRMLKDGGDMFSVYRVRNASSTIARVNQIAFLGSIE